MESSEQAASREQHTWLGGLIGTGLPIPGRESVRASPYPNAQFAELSHPRAGQVAECWLPQGAHSTIYAEARFGGSLLALCSLRRLSLKFSGRLKEGIVASRLLLIQWRSRRAGLASRGDR